MEKQTGKRTTLTGQQATIHLQPFYAIYKIYYFLLVLLNPRTHTYQDCSDVAVTAIIKTFSTFHELKQ